MSCSEIVSFKENSIFTNLFLSIPHDSQIDIFEWLDPISLTKARRVCSSWKQKIDDSFIPSLLARLNSFYIKKACYFEEEKVSKTLKHFKLAYDCALRLGSFHSICKPWEKISLMQTEDRSLILESFSKLRPLIEELINISDCKADIVYKLDSHRQLTQFISCLHFGVADESLKSYRPLFFASIVDTTSLQLETLSLFYQPQKKIWEECLFCAVLGDNATTIDWLVNVQNVNLNVRTGSFLTSLEFAEVFEKQQAKEKLLSFLPNAESNGFKKTTWIKNAFKLCPFRIVDLLEMQKQFGALPSESNLPV